MSDQDSGWFMTAEISRRGRVYSWRYPAGVTERDQLFMERASRVLPSLVEVDPPTVTIRPGNRWFQP